ncbi:hypothetical protein V6N13_148067 [Hibiscus sabdariffa]|uniref:Germin-like protein n=1 Tax=Hibiscus sabdariffa TaxID=183260 RepID=A0ABR2TY20_9ROSI
MKGVEFLVALVLLTLASKLASASDPGPLQDFCVALKDTKDGVVQGPKACSRRRLLPSRAQHSRKYNKPSRIKGTLHVGFVTSNPDNRLITKVLYPGDVFVFPVGLIHFQFNIGNTNAVAFAALSSQNPGVITIANAVFGSHPAINPDVLAKAFQLDVNIVKQLQSRFWWDNN